MGEFRWSRELTTRDKGILRTWNRGGDARLINQSLRTGDESFVTWSARDLDAVISAGSFTATAVVYRGLAVSEDCLNGLTVGTVHADRGYLAVSRERSRAEEFAAKRAGKHYPDGVVSAIEKTGDMPVVLEFTLPADTPAAELHGNGLDEYLLARDSRFRITELRDGLVCAVPLGLER